MFRSNVPSCLACDAPEKLLHLPGNVPHRVADSRNLFGIFVRNRKIEGLFEFHDQLDGIE
jgi:hypothetical protein